ncbi:MAG: hypothetical protein D6729_07170, partial [Deltaproteobacteria bacterium]
GVASLPLYELELTVEGRALRGRVQVSLASPAAGLGTVVFALPAPAEAGGAVPVRVGPVAAVVGAGAPVPTRRTVEAGLVTVTLPRPAAQGERVVVRLEVSGELPLRTTGGYDETLAAFSPGGTRAPIGALATDDRGVTLLGPAPLLAPFRAGRWVTHAAGRFGPPPPAPPACHIAIVEVPADTEVAVAGVRVGRLPVGEGRMRHVFVLAQARRVGLVARPKPRAAHTARLGGVEVRAVARDRATARRLGRWAAAALGRFGQLYRPYPWTRLSVIAAPVNGALGGLRAPGLVVVTDTLEAGPDTSLSSFSAASPDELLELVTVHQVAHQWFGEGVGTPGPADPCIEELLAHHATVEYLRARYGNEEALRLKAALTDATYHTWRLFGGEDGPASRPLAAYPALGAWSATCEGKASRLLLEVEGLIGRRLVRAALRRFVRTYWMKEAGRPELERTFLEAAPGARAKLRALFRRWLDEAHGDEDLGLPVLPTTGPGQTPEDLQGLMRALEQLLSGGP